MYKAIDKMFLLKYLRKGICFCIFQINEKGFGTNCLSVSPLPQNDLWCEWFAVYSNVYDKIVLMWQLRTQLSLSCTNII